MSVSRRGFFRRTLGAVVAVKAAPALVSAIATPAYVSPHVWGSTGGAIPGLWHLDTRMLQRVFDDVDAVMSMRVAVASEWRTLQEGR